MRTHRDTQTHALNKECVYFLWHQGMNHMHFCQENSIPQAVIIKEFGNNIKN